MNKWLEFNRMVVPDRKTKVFEVRNKESKFFLGTIAWHGPWRQYTFQPTAETSVWSAGCLDDISSFMKQLMIDWRAKNVMECVTNV